MSAANLGKVEIDRNISWALWEDGKVVLLWNTTIKSYKKW